MASILATDAIGDFDKQDRSELYLSGSRPRDHRLMAAGLEPSEIRTVIAGSTLSDAKDLLALLKCESGVVVVDECQEIDLETVIRRRKPDLIILNIETGDTVKPAWRDKRLDHQAPIVLCVTSHAQHAARAFAVRALDFLVRPFDQIRFHGALERVRQELLKLHQSHLGQEMIRLWQQRQAQDQPEQLVFKVDGRLIFVDLDDIDWIGASANYVRLNVGAESFLVRESIGRLSTKLDSEHFARIHRSVIVNIRKIKELHSCNAGEYIAVLRNGKKLPCSRGFRSELERYISRCIQVANAR